jgi:non-homologous end joining protein Ku
MGRAQTISTSTKAARIAEIRLETRPRITMIRKINTGIVVWAMVQRIAFRTALKQKKKKTE